MLFVIEFPICGKKKLKNVQIRNQSLKYQIIYFHFLIHSNTEKKKKVKKDLQICITQKLTGFSIVKSGIESKTKELFMRIDITFDLVKHKTFKINCYFSPKKHLACKTIIKKQALQNIVRLLNAITVLVTFFIQYIKKNKCKKSFKDFSGIPSILYNFNTQNLLSFKNNLKYKGDFSFVVYCGSKTTTLSDCLLNPENRNIFPVL